MKLFIKIITSLILLVNVSAQDCRSILIIRTGISPVQIFINDTLKSDSEITTLELPDGRYKITIRENTSGYDAEVIIDSVYLTGCRTVELFYPGTVKKLLDSEPQDAYVFRNDSLLGNTPLFIKGDLSDIYLKKSGYSDYRFTGNDFRNLIKVNLEFTGKEKREDFFKSTAFKVLAGTAIALGAVTAYYKLRADDRFDEYRLRGNPELLDDTEKYDLISGITFTAMQFNIGYILYRILSE